MPDVEVFHSADYPDLTYEIDYREDTTPPGYMSDKGYYYAYGFPGCLWDSDPIGPFETYEKALEDARETAGVYDNE